MNVACISKHQNLIKSYMDLSLDVNKFTKILKDLDCGKGTRVGVWSENRYEWIVTQFSAAKLGCILVNVNPGYRANELKYCLNLVGCHTLISSQRIKSSNYYEILLQLMPLLLKVESTKNLQTEQIVTLRNIVMFPHPEEPAPKNFLRFNDLMKIVDDNVIEIHGVSSSDPTNIQFTSGTTGYPKGATLSHHTLLNNAKFLSEKLMEGMEREKPIICCQVPLYHIFGCHVATLMSAVVGGTIVLPSGIFDANASLQAIEDFNCNFIYGTPTMFVDILNTQKPISEYKTNHLRRAVMAGATCPPELMKSLIKAIPTIEHISIIYGCTECTVTTITSIYDSDEKRFGTVGKPLDHTEVKIVDPETRDILPVNLTGEVLVRGYGTFLGYWNQENKTKEALTSDCWYKTGDIGTIDSDGYLRIRSRINDMVIRGGENIYPREIEEFILTNPKIAEVHVIGVPDYRMGEELCAFIRLKSNETKMDEKELRTFSKDKISHFKIPRFIEFVGDFPRTENGKVKKCSLRKIATQKYGNGIQIEQKI